MDFGLNGKRALVTGSASGIGRGIAAALLEEGCRVVIHGLDRDEAQATAGEVGAEASLDGNLVSDAGADAVYSGARSALGEIDILVNNVGGSAKGSSTMDWEDVTEDMWAETYQISVISAVRMIRRVLPSMKAQGWGRIVQIASAAAAQPLTTGPDYSAAKASIVNLTVSLAKSLGDCGVTANTVSPGMMMTPALSRWIDGLAAERGWGGTREEIERLMTREIVPVPVGRIGRPHQIGAVVCMLCSTPGGDYTSGANFRVDGAQVRSVN